MDGGHSRCQGLLYLEVSYSQILSEMEDGNASSALDWEVGAWGSSAGSATGILGCFARPLWGLILLIFKMKKYCDSLIWILKSCLLPGYKSSVTPHCPQKTVPTPQHKTIHIFICIFQKLFQVSNVLGSFCFRAALKALILIWNTPLSLFIT